jgi:hypothetical protein
MRSGYNKRKTKMLGVLAVPVSTPAALQVGVNEKNPGEL